MKGAGIGGLQVRAAAVLPVGQKGRYRLRPGWPARSRPSLGIMRSACSARSGGPAWARSRARAASRVSLSRAIRRATRRSSGASTVQKASKWWALAPLHPQGRIQHRPAGGGGKGRRDGPPGGPRCGDGESRSGGPRATSSANTWAAIQARSRAPSWRRQAGPKAATTAASPSLPGSTASRARASASITAQPRAASTPATWLFPAAMPPLRPRRGKGALGSGAWSGQPESGDWSGGPRGPVTLIS